MDHRRSLFTTDEVLIIQESLQKFIKGIEYAIEHPRPNAKPQDPEIIVLAKSALEKMVWGEAAAGTTAHSLDGSDEIERMSMNNRPINPFPRQQ